MKKLLIPGALVGVLLLSACGSTDAETETESPANDVASWQESQDYEEYCTGEPSIDPELQPIVDAVTIPDDGHVWMTNFASDSSNPEMNTVSFALCSPAEGDELREIAETLAIEVRQADFGGTISEMGVNASAANPEGTENILRDDSFQSHTHVGGESFENGSYRAAWEVKN